MSRFTTLVVEDEDLARDRLARFVAVHASLELVAACHNGKQAMAELGTACIDIMLLDIEMPGVDGIALSRRLRKDSLHAPVIVFVTAHSEFAIDAFDVRAVDYLLKPFDYERFDRAIQAAIDDVRARRAIVQSERIRELINDSITDTSDTTQDSALANASRIIVRHEGRMQVLRNAQIDWIGADGRMCVIHCGSREHRIKGPLFHLARRLGKNSFVQVSRFAVVNIDSIAELHEMFKGDLIAKLKSGDEVPVSRRYRSKVIEQLTGR